MRCSDRFLPAVLCMAAAAVCHSQSQPNFDYKISASGSAPSNIYAVDLNNDGIPDIIADTASNPNGFSIQLGNGDGTFKAPIFDEMNNGNIAPAPMATGDFNNDGNADLAVVLPGKNLLVLFPGNGDGTFRSDIYSTVSLGSGQTFASAPLVAIDLNKDGKLDLVAVGTSGQTQTIYVLPGNGTGSFSTSRALSTLPSTYTVGNMAGGDFDGDAKADLAFTAVSGCTGSGSCVTNLHALFGDGSFGFFDTVPYNSYDRLQISAGDLDSDGKTDIVSFDQKTQQFVAFYGGADRVFPSYAWTAGDLRFPSQYADGWSGPFQIADFNGDGHMDIAGFASATVYEVANYSIDLYLGTASRGQFTRYFAGYVPSSADPYITPFGTPPVAIDANGDGLPDVVINQTPAASGDHSSPSTLVAEVNTTSSGNWGGCTYPSTAQGIHLCSPGPNSSGTATSFKAAATSFGDLRKIELWVDGKKVAQNFHAWEHNAWFNYTGTLATGSHRATLYAADVDGRLQRLNYNFTTGAACSAPSTNGVHVCSPVNGSTASSPVTVRAAAKVAGTLARMELWVDGVKKFSETTSTSFTTSVSLASGSHRFVIYAVNTAGTKYATTVSATVN